MPTEEMYTAELDDNCVVSTQQVVNNLEQKEFQLIDVRTVERFIGEAEPIDPVAGHIPGAINLPLAQNLDARGCYLSPELLKSLYADINEQWSVEHQVYMCGSGVTACHSVLALAVAGYDLPKVYAGSWSEWIRDAARPIATGQ